MPDRITERSTSFSWASPSITTSTDKRSSTVLTESSLDGRSRDPPRSTRARRHHPAITWCQATTATQQTIPARRRRIAAALDIVIEMRALFNEQNALGVVDPAGTHAGNRRRRTRTCRADPMAADTRARQTVPSPTALRPAVADLQVVL